MKCDFKDICPGCDSWDLSSVEQKQLKIKNLAVLLDYPQDNIKFKTAGDHGLRERFDFIVKDSNYGLMKKEKEFVPLDRCLQLSSPLRNAFEILQKFNLNVKIGTLRLRSSTFVEKFGLWLDFANTDIKILLDEKNILSNISHFFYIEIGQKKKTLLITDSDQHKLSDPAARPWFATFDYTTTPPKKIPLYCGVSSFTQPSVKTAQLLSDSIIEWTRRLAPKTVWEFGCGIGQYTIPLLSLNLQVRVFEIDTFALACLQKSLENLDYRNLLMINQGNFHVQSALKNLNLKEQPDLVLVNPPKSGLKDFTQNLLEIKSPSIIYISCFPETFKNDLEQLRNQYQVIDLQIVDQFPQTKHYEIAALLQRIDI